MSIGNFLLAFLPVPTDNSGMVETKYKSDYARDHLEDLIRTHGVTYATVSLAIAKNHAYVQQYLRRLTPRHLPEDVRVALGQYFGTSPDEFRPRGPFSTMGESAARFISAARKPDHRHSDDMIAEALDGARRLGLVVPEIDFKAGAGGGGLPASELAGKQGDYSVSRDVISGEWVIPEAFLSSELNVRAENARIVTVVGDSMEPTLMSGDKILVDVADKAPSPPGIFCFWDGFGVVIKRLEIIPNTEPPTLVITSDNPKHGRYERTMEEVNIIGRVKSFTRRL